LYKDEVPKSFLWDFPSSLSNSKRQSASKDHARRPPTKMAVMTEYTYVFAFGTMFALLEAFNNGASKSHYVPPTQLY
jgi:hypothetical protein